MKSVRSEREIQISDEINKLLTKGALVTEHSDNNIISDIR